MRKRRPPVVKISAGASSKRPHSAPVGDEALISRRRDPLAREWVPLRTAARLVGFDWRTIRKHIVNEPFVRVLGGRWYVRLAEFRAWWEQQRPRKQCG